MTARVMPEGGFDALVVGGGLAGLTTAWNLRSTGFTVGVLEAKDRVGGRLLLQRTPDGVSVDGGGSWVGRMHTEVIRLMDHFGLHLVPQFNDGQNLLRLNGQTVRYRAPGHHRRGRRELLLPTRRTLAAGVRRRKRVLRDLASFFGPQAHSPVGYIEQDWSQEQWQSGCLPRLQPGVLGRYHRWLTKPAGPLHWAGTETSYEWEGHMEGAVRSGIRAAAEVAADLKKPHDST